MNMTTSSRNRILRNACGLALGLTLLNTGVTQAQDQRPAQGGQRAGIIDEVVVTAQKREESIQDVPVSISVVGGQQLQDMHVTQLNDIAGYVPGMQIVSGGSPGQTGLTLRGLAQVGSGQTVGIYLDDAPVGASSFYARASAFSLDLLPYDVQRMEVLRGPQGTLYGASTIGGLLKYVTYAPDPNKFELRAGADVFGMADADKRGMGGRFGVNAPLIEGKLAVRASYAYQHTPGFIDNFVTGRKDQNEYDQKGGRIALLWQINDDASLELSGLWQGINSDDNATQRSSLPPIVPVGGGRLNGNLTREPFHKQLDYYSATLKWNLGWANFTSASSYSDTVTDQISDASASYGILYNLLVGIPDAVAPFELNMRLKKFTEELRLQSASEGRVEWLLGAFFTDEKNDNFQRIDGYFPDGSPIAALPILAKLALPTKYREYSLFGDLTYKFTDRFDITAGVRWARNDQEYAEIDEPGPLLPGQSVFSKSSEDVWTYMFSPRFHVTDDTMVYGRVANGYRPGGPNAPLAGAPPTVDSDSVVNYEIGVKSEFLDRRAFIDAAVYYMDWTDIQVAVVNDGISYLANAAKAKSKGVEVSAAVMPVDGLRFGLTVAYADSYLTGDVPPPGPGLKGDPLPNVPKWSGSLSADYAFDLSSDWRGSVGAGYRYTGKRPSAVASDPDVIISDGYGALDLNASVANEHWTVRLFVRNATDKNTESTIATLTDVAFSAPQFVYGTVLQPRTVGLGVDFTF